MPLTQKLPAHAALLLDLDGTLIDIAPTPSMVVVPPGLTDALRRLRRRLDDALAIISGRPIEQIAALLGDAPYAVAGEHGAVIRHTPDGTPERAGLPPVPPGWLEQAARVVAGCTGVLLEPKSNGFVLHYRLAPEAGPALRQALLDITAGDETHEVMPAHMAWEVKARGVDKGIALNRIMQRVPFAGRVPVFIGDDVTDEAAIQAARAAGGLGLRVQEAFGTPEGVRAWLTFLAG